MITRGVQASTKAGLILTLVWVCFNSSAMAQSVRPSLSLEHLLTFQASASPEDIDSILSDLGGWVSGGRGSLSLSNGGYSAEWVKALPDEEFLVDSKDNIFLLKDERELHGPIILYLTLEKSEFQSLHTYIKESMDSVESMIHTDANVFVYSNIQVVIQVSETLVPVNGFIRYGFIVYEKSDYERGFRIR